jgi:hypothetical protein
MTATKRDSLVCTVCRKPLLIGEEYLVRMRDGHPRTVHRHLCFPPAVPGGAGTRPFGRAPVIQTP